MALTGRSDGPPLQPPPGLVRGLDQLVESIAHWSAEVGNPVHADWSRLLTVRARLRGLHRNGRTSPNGSCRLIRALDGWVALNLSRESDRVAIGALSGVEPIADPWSTLESAVAGSPVCDLLERARLLGIPAAPVGRGGMSNPPWSARQCWPAISGRSATVRPVDELQVVDLSSMWAGPLAASIIAECGGRITKVESASRPDGARGDPSFYETLHPADQKVMTLDFESSDGRLQLAELVDRADVVIESSRPRALEQLGVTLETLRAKPGKVWLSITGYGRGEPERNWVAFGDDAAVAGGLVAWEDDDRPVFCGDAVADPVTGMTAAAAALEAIAQGGGVLLDVSMRSSVSHLLERAPRLPARPALNGGNGWYVSVGGRRVAVQDRGIRSQPDGCTTRPATTVAATG
jgi:CoA-transferase family III